MQSMRLLVADNKVQFVLDALQTILVAQPFARIVVLPVEMSLPKGTEDERKKEASATVFSSKVSAHAPGTRRRKPNEP